MRMSRFVHACLLTGIASAVIILTALPESTLGQVIPLPTDQNRYAQSRKPMEIMRHGWSTSLFQASQQWSTTSS
jgi:hypothetical protein